MSFACVIGLCLIGFFIWDGRTDLCTVIKKTKELEQRDDHTLPRA